MLDGICLFLLLNVGSISMILWHFGGVALERRR